MHGLTPSKVIYAGYSIICFQLFTPHLATEFWAALRCVPAVDNRIELFNREVNEQCWPEVDLDANIDFIINVKLWFFEFRDCSKEIL